MDAVQPAWILACEYDPPGNIEGGFAYVSYSRSKKSKNLREIFFFFIQ